MSVLHPSLLHVLSARGYHTPGQINQLLDPPLGLSSFAAPHMEKAIKRLRLAIQEEAPIAIDADRDVDGLSGLAILTRSLTILGAKVHWGSPLEGRGLERPVLVTLASSGAKVMILVDCGTGEASELAWLASQGIDVIIADHHRMLPQRPPAYAWIHPEAALKPSFPAVVGGESMDPPDNRRTPDVWRPRPAAAGDDNSHPCGASSCQEFCKASGTTLSLLSWFC